MAWLAAHTDSQHLVCGSALFLLSCCLFITVRWRESKAAARLRYANNKWLRTFDAVPDLLVITGPDARIRRLNLAAAERLGIDRLDTPGVRICELLGCNRDGQPECPHRQMAATGAAACSPAMFFPRLEGYFAVSVSPILAADGTVEGAVHVLQDVSERTRLEHSLRDTAERLALATDGSNDVTWEWNMATNEGHVNHRFYEMTGYRPGDVEPGIETFLASIHPDDRDRVLELMRAHLEGKSSMFTAQYRLVTRTGRIRHVMGRGRLVRPLTMAGMVTDITQQIRHAEEANRSQHLESIGILAGGLAHDFNNVLNVVEGNVSYAAMICEEGSAIAAALADAEAACESARELGTRLQMLAQQGDPVREPLVLDEVVRDALATVFRESDLRCSLVTAPGSHLLDGDPRQLRQLFANLLVNARDTVDADGWVRVAVGAKVVDEDGNLPLPPGRYLHVSIEDNGRGIAEELLARIFDPYFSTKDSYREKGIGLGLPICHAIVKRHRGHITLASRPGEGTTVTVYLPAAGG